MSWGLDGIEGWPTIKSYTKTHIISILIFHLNVTRNKQENIGTDPQGQVAAWFKLRLLDSSMGRETMHYLGCIPNLQKFPRNDAFAGLARVDNTSLHIEQDHLQPQTMVHPNPLPEKNSEQNTIRSAKVSRSSKTSCLYLEVFLFISLK